MVRIRRSAFPGRATYANFATKFGPLCSPAATGEAKDQCVKILEAAGLAPDRHYALGKTMVFLRNAVEGALNAKLVAMGIDPAPMPAEPAPPPAPPPPKPAAAPPPAAPAKQPSAAFPEPPKPKPVAAPAPAPPPPKPVVAAAAPKPAPAPLWLPRPHHLLLRPQAPPQD